MNSQQHILLLEDDPNLGFMLQENLELREFTVKRCLNGEEGLSAYKAEHFDLCLVDIMMPKMDGFAFVREVRKFDQQIPVIFLTAKSLKEDKLEGFRVGADDYITKPFSMEEVVLRIQAVLRRSTPAPPTSELPTEFTIGEYTFESSRQLLRRKNTIQKLTAREAELLNLLCLYINKTLEREYALKQIWGDDSYFNGRSMDVFISRLRSYLKNDASVQIMNVHGKGFKLVANLEEQR